VISLRTKIYAKIFVLAPAALLTVAISFAQESSSKASATPANASTTTSGPSVALRDALSAACAQNQSNFVRFLTARNKEAFSRMTPAARVAFMKRFVLLNEPGKATASVNPSGRPIVRCETPDVTTEMQIGGAELRDNLAFLPMELRDATDTTVASVRQITLGLVREDGEWKLLSLGVLFMDLPALEAEWDAAQVESTEREAIDSLRKIAEAIELYRRSYSRLPDSLAYLGPPVHGKANAEAAALLDSDLATGMKNGYAFRYVVVGASTLGAPAKFELAATPLQYGRTGRRSFFRDAGGVLHGADHRGAIGNETDPKID
jgi:hypothetical protein